jgi:hemoglobin
MQKWNATLFAVMTTALLVPGLRAAETNKSLYDRLGGMPAVQAVTDNLVDRILADQRVNKWFAHAASSPENAKAYKSTLATFLCQNTGGPCKYTGPNMSIVHKGRGITGAAFDAVVEDLVAVLNKFSVPQQEKTELLQILAPLKNVIVER